MAFGCAFFFVCFSLFPCAPGVSWVLVRSGVGSDFGKTKTTEFGMTLL